MWCWAALKVFYDVVIAGYFENDFVMCGCFLYESGRDEAVSMGN